MIKNILTILTLLIGLTSYGQEQPKLSPDSLYHKDNGEKIYLKTEVDSIAKYQPNDDELFNFILKNISYPSDARENDIQGKVYVSFIVEKNGVISDLIVIKSLSESCDNEAKRLISILPNKWTPAIKNGQAVRFQYIFPFSFKLKGSKSKRKK